MKLVSQVEFWVVCIIRTLTWFGTESYGLDIDTILKISVNIGDNIFCVIFWAKTVLIPPDHNLSIPLDYNVSTFFVINMCNRSICRFGEKNYA